jgi:hypothetical protein
VSSASVVDTSGIEQVLYRYCRSMDRMDKQLTLSCFMPDADMSYGILYRGKPAGFVEWLWPVHAAMVNHSHMIGNVLVESVDGVLVSEAYVQVTLRSSDENGQFDIVSKGRYLDSWNAKNGVYRISERMYVSDLSTVVPVTERSLGAVLHPNALQNKQPAGTRNEHDPSYTLFVHGSPFA